MATAAGNLDVLPAEALFTVPQVVDRLRARLRPEGARFSPIGRDRIARAIRHAEIPNLGSSTRPLVLGEDVNAWLGRLRRRTLPNPNRVSP